MTCDYDDLLLTYTVYGILVLKLGEIIGLQGSRGKNDGLSVSRVC